MVAACPRADSRSLWGNVRATTAALSAGRQGSGRMVRALRERGDRTPPTAPETPLTSPDRSVALLTLVGADSILTWSGRSHLVDAARAETLRERGRSPAALYCGCSKEVSGIFVI